jgi:uncharacterized protein YkwD
MVSTIVVAIAAGAIFISQAAEDGERIPRMTLLDSSSQEASANKDHDGGGDATPEPAVLSPKEKQLLDAHNAQRAQAGLSVLNPDPALVDVARERATDMVTNDYFSHEAPDGETIVNLLKREGYEYKVMGENIARNNRPEAESVAAAMTGFVSSPSHQEHLLSSRYDRIGVATASNSAGMHYFVIVFTGT